MTTPIRFKLGNFYKSEKGEVVMHVVADAETILFGACMIAEVVAIIRFPVLGVSRVLKALSNEAGATKIWTEIDHDEFCARANAMGKAVADEQRRIELEKKSEPQVVQHPDDPGKSLLLEKDDFMRKIAGNDQKTKRLVLVCGHQVDWPKRNLVSGETKLYCPECAGKPQLKVG